MSEMARSVSLLGAQRIATGLLGAVRTKIAAAFLGPAGMGILAQATTVQELLLQSSNLGTSRGFLKLAAESGGRRDARALARLIQTTVALVGGIATLLFGRAHKRFSSRVIFIACMACTAMGLGTQGVTNDWRIAGASLTLTGISMGWLVANINTSAIALVDAQQRGTALGIIRAVSALATLLGISQPLQTALGIKGIFLSVAGLSALVLVGLATGALPLRRVEAKA